MIIIQHKSLRRKSNKKRKHLMTLQNNYNSIYTVTDVPNKNKKRITYAKRKTVNRL